MDSFHCRRCDSPVEICPDGYFCAECCAEFDETGKQKTYTLHEAASLLPSPPDWKFWDDPAVPFNKQDCPVCDSIITLEFWPLHDGVGAIKGWICGCCGFEGLINEEDPYDTKTGLWGDSD